MKILITGICGFVGSTIARRIKETHDDIALVGLDNLSRAGSELNRPRVTTLCDSFVHGDLRASEDLDSLPAVDWVIDAAAIPSVLAGTDGHASSRQLVNHNLTGTLNLLEYCRRTNAGLILLSTSRVYSIAPLSQLNLIPSLNRYEIDSDHKLPAGVSVEGISESFSTLPPVSLYGATKICSETMAMEYSHTFGFPLRINRCGVLAGAGQFGRADQGIFSFWIHSHLARRPLRYIGCGGTGYQVRDCLHPNDLADLITKQIAAGPNSEKPILNNVSGGITSSMSLCQLTDWCDTQFGNHQVTASCDVRPFDLPWIVLDSALARNTWQWSPRYNLNSILDEIADFARRNPHWLDIAS